jgi:hypothetical protein
MEVELAVGVKRGLLCLRAQNEGSLEESKEDGAFIVEALESQRLEMADYPPVLVPGYLAAMTTLTAHGRCCQGSTCNDCPGVGIRASLPLAASPICGTDLEQGGRQARLPAREAPESGRVRIPCGNAVSALEAIRPTRGSVLCP